MTVDVNIGSPPRLPSGTGIIEILIYWESTGFYKLLCKQNSRTRCKHLFY